MLWILITGTPTSSEPIDSAEFTGLAVEAMGLGPPPGTGVPLVTGASANPSATATAMAMNTLF